MAATQEALYGRIDLALSWSEADLPERERTKHVHRLHPYLGKFVPQLVEALLDRYVVPGGHVLDPFAGSGTTLVQALESGRDATGVGHRRVQLPADARQDAPAQPRRGAPRSALGARPGGGIRGRRPGARRRDVVRARLVRAARGGGAAPLPLARRRGRLGRRPARDPRPRRALGAPHDALRPRLPPGAAGRAVLVPQAPPHVPPRRGGAAVPPPLHARHARPDRDVRGGAGDRMLTRRCGTATRASSTSAARSTASSPRRRIRA